MIASELESILRGVYKDCATMADNLGATEVANQIRRLADGLEVTVSDDGCALITRTLRVRLVNQTAPKEIVR